MDSREYTEDGTAPDTASGSRESTLVGHGAVPDDSSDSVVEESGSGEDAHREDRFER